MRVVNGWVEVGYLEDSHLELDFQKLLKLEIREYKPKIKITAKSENSTLSKPHPPTNPIHLGIISTDKHQFEDNITVKDYIHYRHNLQFISRQGIFIFRFLSDYLKHCDWETLLFSSWCCHVCYFGTSYQWWIQNSLELILLFLVWFIK